METGEIFEKIRTIISDLLELDPAEITPDTRLGEDLNADSLLFLEFFEEMKDEFRSSPRFDRRIHPGSPGF